MSKKLLCYIFVAISISLLAQHLFKNTFLMSMRFFNWIHEAYKKTLCQKLIAASTLWEKMLFMVQNDSISFMMETFDIIFLHIIGQRVIYDSLNGGNHFFGKY